MQTRNSLLHRVDNKQMKKNSYKRCIKAERIGKEYYSVDSNIYRCKLGYHGS